MKHLFTNRFFELHFDETIRVFKMIWSSNTEDMTKQDFKEGLLKYVSYYDELKPYGVLHDMRENRFVIASDVQNWTNENINRRAFEVGLKKVAFLVGNDIFTMVSVEQTMEEKEGALLFTSYFDTEEDAWIWLKQK